MQQVFFARRTKRSCLGKRPSENGERVNSLFTGLSHLTSFFLSHSRQKKFGFSSASQRNSKSASRLKIIWMSYVQLMFRFVMSSPANGRVCLLKNCPPVLPSIFLKEALRCLTPHCIGRVMELSEFEFKSHVPMVRRPPLTKVFSESCSGYLGTRSN